MQSWPAGASRSMALSQVLGSSACACLLTCTHGDGRVAELASLRLQLSRLNSYAQHVHVHVPVHMPLHVQHVAQHAAQDPSVKLQS